MIGISSIRHTLLIAQTKSYKHMGITWVSCKLNNIIIPHFLRKGVSNNSCDSASFGWQAHALRKARTFGMLARRPRTSVLIIRLSTVVKIDESKTSSTITGCITREYELRERSPVATDNYLISIL